MNGQKKILVIEDDKFLAKMVSRALEAKNYHVILASSGSEGLRKVTNEAVDLVLLDIILPDLDGFDILKRIRENEKIKNVPVIILSNLGQPEDVSQGSALGVKDYLIKTDVSLDTIVERVGAVFA